MMPRDASLPNLMAVVFLAQHLEKKKKKPCRLIYRRQKGIPVRGRIQPEYDYVDNYPFVLKTLRFQFRVPNQKEHFRYNYVTFNFT